MTNTSLYTFLFDIVKLLVTICIGILSLSIAFVDKIKLDLNNRAVKKTLSALWICLIATMILSIGSGFAIFDDIGLAIHNSTSEVNPKTKVLVILSLTTFCCVIFALVRIGIYVIKQKKIETTTDLKLQEPTENKDTVNA